MVTMSTKVNSQETMSGSDGSNTITHPRSVVKSLLAASQSLANGVDVKRSIGRRELRNVDPFLMFEEYTGFETVTYMLEWITAGRGTVHSEMATEDGIYKGLQLWINLSSKDKMIEPNYQELLADDIPTFEQDGVIVKVLAGEFMGIKSPIYTKTPTMYFDFTLQPGAQVSQPVPESYNAFVYIIQGEGDFGGLNAPVHHCLVLNHGDGIIVSNNSSQPLRFVLIGGKPVNEPVVKHDPFVMNTQAEIQQAIEDYQNYKNGFELAKTWKSR